MDHTAVVFRLLKFLKIFEFAFNVLLLGNSKFSSIPEKYKHFSMEHKKRNLGHKPFESLIQEIASESMLKAPPPTPCLSLQQKSGSVPDIRIIDILQKDKSSLKSIAYRNLNHAICSNRRAGLKYFFEHNGKRSTSDHSLSSGNTKFAHYLIGQGPATSNVLHSVRQKLLNLYH